MSAMHTLLTAANRLQEDARRQTPDDHQRAKLIVDAQIAYADARAGLVVALPADSRLRLAELWGEGILGQYEHLSRVSGSASTQEQQVCRAALDSAAAELEEWVRRSCAEIEQTGTLASFEVTMLP